MRRPLAGRLWAAPPPVGPAPAAGSLPAASAALCAATASLHHRHLCPPEPPPALQLLLEGTKALPGEPWCDQRDCLNNWRGERYRKAASHSLSLVASAVDTQGGGAGGMCSGDLKLLYLHIKWQVLAIECRTALSPTCNASSTPGKWTTRAVIRASGAAAGSLPCPQRSLKMPTTELGGRITAAVPCGWQGQTSSRRAGDEGRMRGDFRRRGRVAGSGQRGTHADKSAPWPVKWRGRPSRATPVGSLNPRAPLRVPLVSTPACSARHSGLSCRTYLRPRCTFISR